MSKQSDSDKWAEEVDSLVQMQYQKYMATKKGLLGSGEKFKEKAMKENIQYNNSPGEKVTFARLREMNREQQQYQKLLELLNCCTFQQALIKVNRVNKSYSLLEGVKKIIKGYTGSEEPTLQQSLKIIKQIAMKQEKNRQIRFQ